MSQRAVLRVCASCEWVFRSPSANDGCPECGFGHYGARYVYGDKAYQYERTQEPWIQKQILKLREYIRVGGKVKVE